MEEYKKRGTLMMVVVMLGAILIVLGLSAPDNEPAIAVGILFIIVGFSLAIYYYKEAVPTKESELPKLTSEDIVDLYKRSFGLKEAFRYHQFIPSAVYKMPDKNSPYRLYFDRNTNQMACISSIAMAFFDLKKMNFDEPITIQYNLDNAPSAGNAFAKDLAASTGKTILLSSLTIPLGFGVNVASANNSNRSENAFFLAGFHFQFLNGNYFDLFAYEKPVQLKRGSKEANEFRNLEKKYYRRDCSCTTPNGSGFVKFIHKEVPFLCKPLKKLIERIKRLSFC